VIKILVACEESQTVTKAFRALGYTAYLCDITPCSGGHPEWHIQQDVMEVISDEWDLMVGHPPCTYLAYSGNRWWNNDGRLQKRLEALNFFAKLWLAPIPYICLENPAGCASPVIAKYSQVIQPYFFGDTESKKTWLWLKNLPQLKHTDVVKPKIYGTYKRGKHKGEPIYFHSALRCNKERSRKRSKTFPGIAKAMAEQWGEYIIKQWKR